MSLDAGIQSLAAAVGTAVKGKISISEKGVANGVATLDGTGKIPSGQLPSYVDDVVEYSTQANFPGTGSSGILYIALDTNKQYRWGGSSYAQITSGAVDSVAGKTGVVSLVKGDVGLNNVDNTSDASKPVSTAQQTALDLKVDKIGGKGLSTEDYTAAEKSKLAGIAIGANNYTLPNASSTVTGGVKLASDTVQSSAVNAITSTASRTYGVQVNASGQAVVNVPWVDTDTTYAVATTSVNGLMSSTDKTKLDGVATGANNYVHPTGDGNLHVPATSTTNNGKVLMAGATAGSLSWASLAISDTSGLQAALDTKATSTSVTTLSNNIGATDTNYVTVFNAALV